MVPFLLVGHPRAGNVFLTKILNQHPRAYCAGEVFNCNPAHEHVAYAAAALGRPAPIAAADLPELLARVGEREGRSCVGVTVFRHPVHTLSDDDVSRLIDAGPKVIVLARRNLLRAYFSWVRACRTNLWHYDGAGQPILWKGAPAPDLRNDDIDRLDVAAAKDWVQGTERFLKLVRERLAARGDRGLELSYEDLCSPNRAAAEPAVRAVFDYLGLDPVPFTVETLPTTDRTAYDRVQNRRELEASLGYAL